MRPCMHALGGILDVSQPVHALRRHRFAMGEKAFYKYLRHFKGKAPLRVKLQAFAQQPRATALFLSPIMLWCRSALLEAMKWERRLLRVAFRMRPAREEGRMRYYQRTAHRLYAWMDQTVYKQIHVAVLERCFNHIWRERTTAQQLASIRMDRGPETWDFLKQFACHTRTREGCPVQSKPGPQRH